MFKLISHHPAPLLPLLYQVVDSTDAMLYSIDKVMKSMVTGSESDFHVAANRFLAGNGYDTAETATHLHIVNEVYNLSYAMKVLIR